MAENNPSQTKVCPTCGTRLTESTTRCLVCGTELSQSTDIKKPASVQPTQMPEITLSLPLAMGLLALFLLVGAALTFAAVRLTGGASAAQPTATPSTTPTVTYTPTEVPTLTPIPTETPLPPFDYTVASGDSCLAIAFTFKVSVQSIIILNNLSSSCTLSVGQKLKIPYPTPTPLPKATITVDPQQQIVNSCDNVAYTVQKGDTLSRIAANYALPADEIKIFNSMTTDNVLVGMKILIPLCKRAPTAGPSPTATIPPPYPAPNLLLPVDGASFTLANENITLQWASIGTLRDNEAYQVIIEDVTESAGRRLVEYVRDNKFIVPTQFRPKDAGAHIFRWWITPVRQNGTDAQGQPIWVVGGDQSAQRVFSWQGVAPQPTP